jgi:tRNA 2-thiocytidine biosynthesis protein TtcA
VRRADEQFNMIRNGDTVAVGVSGGKDSMLLVKALSMYRDFAKAKFQVVAVNINLGFDGFDAQPIARYCESLDVPFTCIDTKIGKIIFDERKEKSPCALCSKMKKGALFTELKRQGINKCAFGHHRDDCIESLLMSMFYEGRIRTFKPVTYLDRMDITLIRPLVFLAEHEIISAAKRFDIPVVKSPCPACGNTKRQETKELLRHLSKSNPALKDILLTALKNTDQYSLWDKP